MSIEFMLIGGPRSGTTWAANWLTTDTTICLHDPLSYRHFSEWDGLEFGTKTVGISDTGISTFYSWLNQHPARKVIVHRNKGEIAKSLGIPEYAEVPCYLERVNGVHVDFMELFDNPKPIYEFLLQKEFDADRHKELKSMSIQPFNEELKFDTALLSRLVGEIKGLSHAN